MKVTSSSSKQLRRLLDRVKLMGTNEGENFVAFSGGVDSSLTAALVKLNYPTNSKCVIGVSSSLPQTQLKLASIVTNFIDIPLIEVMTTEGSSEEYLKNEGMSCYACKTHLYSALTEVHQSMQKIASGGHVIMFNGTNKDDLQDKTRVGLIAAKEFRVASPLDELTKAEVRAVAYELRLPNHAHAASPCLRSRLAYGVRATGDNLERIEAAETILRSVMNPSVEHNIRVRHMSDGGAVIQLDREVLDGQSDMLPSLADQIALLGFSYVKFDSFRSGSLAKQVAVA